MPKEWDAFFDWLMDAEGRVVHCDPRDPGGQTCWGIARRYHPEWPGWAVVDRHSPSQPPRAVIAPLVSAFYRALLASWWGRFVPPLREALCDIVVNMGESKAGRLLQRAANARFEDMARATGTSPAHWLTVDGVVGPRTQEAVAALEPWPLTLALCAQRRDAYEALAQRKPKMRVFLRGWHNRVNGLEAYLWRTYHHA